MPAGRPTKLTPALIKKAKAYVAGDWKKPGYVVPTVEGLALELWLARSTVYEWAEKHEEFSDIVNDLLAVQSQLLVQKGLSGAFNPSITKLILSGKHGYVEKSQQDLTTDGKAINPMLVKIVGKDDSGGAASS